nr:ABC transporter ATP-binding protein [Corynebacterium anserum]
MTNSSPAPSHVPYALEARNITVRFSQARLPTLQNVSLTIPSGQQRTVIGVVGPNGSGKTTLLKALLGALPLEVGEVFLHGKVASKMSRKAVARKVSLVAQDPDPAIPLRVEELVMLGRMPHAGIGGPGAARDRQVVQEALACVGAERLAGRFLSTLSGGERQRVLIARALAQHTDVVLLDEPTNHLDIRYQHDVLQLLRVLPVSALVVLHDLNLAAQYCDVIHVMNKGRIVASGSPREVLTPEILEPVYGVTVETIDVRGRLHLLFGR